MMSPEVIRSISAEAARKAAKARKLPLMVEADDLLVDDNRLVRHVSKCPFLGDYLPAGYERVNARDLEQLPPKARHYNTLFVDMTGWGSTGEPAITLQEFAQVVRTLGPGYGYGIADQGQFQVNVYIYREVAR